MKNRSIVALVVVSCVVTLILSVLMNTTFLSFSISPKELAKVIVKNPYVFMEAVREASEKYQKIAVEREIEDQFKNPVKIETKGRVTFGNEGAPVTIVEYSDFQCPYCARASANVKKIIKKYKGKVNLVYKHFPLSFHPFAQPASIYFEALALEDHEKARKFHDEIFDNFDKYARLKSKKKIDQTLASLVSKVGADLSQVKKNLSKAEAVVESDKAEGEAIKVRGTPSFFINGVKPGRSGMEEVIDRHLKNL